MHPNLRWEPQPNNLVTYIGATEHCDVYRTQRGNLVVRWGPAGGSRATSASDDVFECVKLGFGEAEVAHLKLLIELFGGEDAASTGP